ncbi:MAG: hypothetical protein M3O15_10660 [Acidobacteriota bacterium]|nr:hypothetical protein [Acidobacteriota bacterium]
MLLKKAFRAEEPAPGSQEVDVAQEADMEEVMDVEDSHLSLETLAKWLTGRLEPEEMLNQVIPHFLLRCPDCRDRYHEIQRVQEEVGHWDELVVVMEGRMAPELLDRLGELPYEEQLRRIDVDEDLHAWGLCRLLLKKSREAAFENPARAADLANFAVKISRHLGESYDPEWVLDLRAAAFAYLGNARRVLGELRSAEDAFHDALGLLGRSTSGNASVEAEILDLMSSLRIDQRRLPEALALVDQVLSIYQEGGRLQEARATMLRKAKLLGEMGRLEEAIELLQVLLGQLDAAEEPRLHRYARFNLLVCLTIAGRYTAAEQLLPEVRELFGEGAQPLDLVRLRWVEGNVAFGLGRVGPAEAAFREVQEEFLKRGMGYDAALVSLDLSILYAQEGATRELKHLASQLLPVFESRDVHREAVAALMLFQHACEQERLTVDLARYLADFLRRERRDTT